MKIGIAGDKIVGGKPLLTSLLDESGEKACMIKIKKSFRISWPKQIEFLRLPDVKQIKKCDILHAVFPFHTFEAIILAKFFRKKVVFHWIGTDVWYLLGNWKDNLKRGQYAPFFYKIFFKTLKLFADIHLCGSENLKKELSGYGIRAKIVPIVPLEMNFPLGSNRLPLAVLSYLPEERHEFYGSEIFFKLADSFPRVKFFALGMKQRRKDEKSNVSYLPYQENMNEIFEKIGLVFRMPKHDGMALIVLEGLLRGKQVIFSYDFPFCYYATNFLDAKNALKQFVKSPRTNRAGAEFVKEEFNQQKIANELIKVYKQVLIK